MIAAVTSFVVVRNTLIGDLQRSLREDALRVVDIYRANEAAPPPEGPTGGVFIQLYDAGGRMLLGSAGPFENAALPPDVVQAGARGLTDWSGEMARRPVQAALAPADFAVVAVIAPTNFIGQALVRLGRALAATAILLVILAAALAYAVATAAVRPLRLLARGAARLDPDYLQPIRYTGPNDEVGQLARTLNDLIVRLRGSMDAQRAFLAETSHELRTPLTSLQGFLDRAVRRATPEGRRELEDAQRIARTMSRLVADLLQLSRGEIVREVVPHLIDPRTELLEPIAEEFPGVTLEAGEGELILGDPERLRQLLRNLVSNAVRAAGTTELVTIRMQRTGVTLSIEVIDQGPGIAPEVMPRIFEKFYKGSGGGAGLGLAIVRQIAEGHGGSVEATSEPGKGATFRVVLPLLPEDADA